MGRLRRLPDRVGALTPRLRREEAGEAARSRRRDATQEWRRWYKTARWQKLRWSVLVRDGFQCQRPDCGRVEHDSSRLVADHRTPHHGDAALFWDPVNLQTLCKPCHDQWKQSLERRLGL